MMDTVIHNQEDVVEMARKALLTPLTAPEEIELLSQHENGTLSEEAQKRNLLFLNNNWLLTANPAETESLSTFKAIASRYNITPKIMVTTEGLIRSYYESKELFDASITDNLIEKEETETKKKLLAIIREGMGKTSDIHLEVDENKAVVKHRQGDELNIISNLSVAWAKAIINVAFQVLASKDFNYHRIESGSFTEVIDDKTVRIRINYQPTDKGGDLVMRFLSDGSSEQAVSLEELGYEPLHIDLFDAAARRGSGAILISGPTGSGKTTTLAALLSSLPKNKKIYTIEDPVEKIIPNARQINVTGEAEDSDKISEIFLMYQKNLLRQDPDIAMLGEVRDYNVAKTMFQMSLTGHITLGTIHTNGAIAVLTRLNDMGVSWDMLSDPSLIRLLAYQRLATKLCPHCKRGIGNISKEHPYIKEPANRRAYMRIYNYFKNTGFAGVFTRNPSGCEHCQQGKAAKPNDRTVLTEIIQLDNAGRSFIQKGDMLGLKNYLISQGWESITDHAIRLVQAGEIDPFESDSAAGTIGSIDEENKFDYRAHRNPDTAGPSLLIQEAR